MDRFVFRVRFVIDAEILYGKWKSFSYFGMGISVAFFGFDRGYPQLQIVDRLFCSSPLEVENLKRLSERCGDRDECPHRTYNRLNIGSRRLRYALKHCSEAEIVPIRLFVLAICSRTFKSESFSIPLGTRMSERPVGCNGHVEVGIRLHLNRYIINYLGNDFYICLSDIIR